MLRTSSTRPNAEITPISLLPAGWRRERALSASPLLDDAQGHRRRHGAVPGYVYATRGTDLYIANFVASETTLDIDGATVTVSQQTEYPWNGAVRLRVDPLREARFTVRLRIPGWARGRPVPSDLYRYDDGIEPVVGLRVNDEPTEIVVNAGFAVIDRTWSPGDTVELDLPMPARQVVSNPAVEADSGAVALERGPLLYAVEGIDNGGNALGFALAADPGLQATWAGGMLGGIVRVTANATPPAPAGDAPQRLVAIPYFAWSNRGPGEMAVWLRRR